MKILIVGGAGMVGRKLLERLAAVGQVGETPIDEVTIFDVVTSAVPPADFQIRCETGDLTDDATVGRLVAERPDLVFHLAAIVSGEAEADFDKGYRINLDGTRRLLEQMARMPDYCPRVVFTSSIAVFGAPFPESIDDEFFLTPLTSYGTQKAIGELLLNDFSRRGLLDGVGIRLPTICVRPGRPNRAASGFFSNIIREPLAGEEAVLPVDADVRHWHASPRSAVNFLIHAATLPSAALGHRRNLTMPGVSVTVGEQLDALRRIAGDAVVQRIRHEPDEKIVQMVAGWPRNFQADRARSLGFVAETTFDQIIQVHIEDELAGNFVK